MCKRDRFAPYSLCFLIGVICAIILYVFLYHEIHNHYLNKTLGYENYTCQIKEMDSCQCGNFTFREFNADKCIGFNRCTDYGPCLNYFNYLKDHDSDMNLIVFSFFYFGFGIAIIAGFFVIVFGVSIDYCCCYKHKQPQLRYDNVPDYNTTYV